MESILSMMGIGAGVVVALIALVGTVVKIRYDRKRELLKCAIETAHKDFEGDLQLRLNGIPTSGPLPMSSYVAYHHSFLKLVENGETAENAADKSLRMLKELLDVYKKTELEPYREFQNSERSQ